MLQSSSESAAPLPPELQYRFQRNLKPLRDKHGPCAACQKLPPEGTTFRVCTACKAVLYCSRECQKANWAKHKYVVIVFADNPDLEPTTHVIMLSVRHNCQYYQKLPNTQMIKLPNSCWPPSLSLMERESIFGHFYDLHSANFVMAATVLRRALLPRVINFDTEAFVFVIAYRADNGGNPAKMFTFERARLVTKEMLTNKDSPELAAARRRRVAMESKEGEKRTLLITVIAEELGRDLYLPVPKEITTEGRDPADTNGMNALRSVKDLIERGIVITKDDDRHLRAGHMVKEGKTWQWQWAYNVEGPSYI